MTVQILRLVLLSIVFRSARIDGYNYSMSCILRSLIVSFVGVFWLLIATESIHAQEEPKPSPDPAVFKAQLIQFTQLTRKNLRDIQTISVDDSVPIDPVFLRSAHNAYLLIRAARWGIDLAMQRQTTYQDPTLALAHNRIDEAWNLARYPWDFRNNPRAEYISTSVQNLSRSVKIVQLVLVILP